MKILVVDGHTEAAEALAIRLELLGHEAKSATGKGEALRAALTLKAALQSGFEVVLGKPLIADGVICALSRS